MATDAHPRDTKFEVSSFLTPLQNLSLQVELIAAAPCCEIRCSQQATMSAQSSQAAGSGTNQTISEADRNAMKHLQKQVSYLLLALSFYPLPLSSDAEEARRRDVFNNLLGAKFDMLNAELQRLHPSCHGSIEFRELVTYVRETCTGLLKIHDLRESLVDSMITVGMERANHTVPPQPAQHDNALLWSQMLAEFPLPAPLAHLISDDDEYEPATVQFLPPGALALYRGWEKDLEDAAAEINVHRTAQQIAADPLDPPPFDSMSRAVQSYTDETGVKYTIVPGKLRDGVPLPEDNVALGIDNHTLQGYNELLAKWEEAASMSTGRERETWTVITQVPKNHRDGLVEGDLAKLWAEMWD